MEYVFCTGHQEQLNGLVPWHLLKTCSKIDWLQFLRLLDDYLLDIRLYLLYMPVCLFMDFCGCLAVKKQKSNSKSKRCPKR